MTPAERRARLEGAVEALEELRGELDTVFPGDLPHITEATIDALVEQCRAELAALEKEEADGKA